MKNMVDKQVVNLQLPATNDHVWFLFEGLIREGIGVRISLEMQRALISRMKIFNDRMISLLASFYQNNTKDFSIHQIEKIRINLQPLIIDVFFDRLELELEKQILKNSSLKMKKEYCSGNHNIK
jgi:hypothetical protein